MFTLYPANETEFFNNGLLEIDDIITNCKVENGINSPFIANLTIFKDELEKYKEVEGEKIILLPTPQGKQPFRVVDIMPIDDFEMNVFCRHVFHDIGKRTVNRCKVDNGNGAFILNKFKQSLDKEIPHNFTSNIATQTSFDWVRKKGLNALLEDDNSFLSKLGGELDINGFNVAINTRIGNDKGFTAMYRKNITGFNGKISFDGLITRIMPVGFDGITLNELYVDSENINKYNDIYSEIIEFSEVKWKGSPNNSSEEGFDTLEQAQAELIKQAKQYYLDTKCDIVQANFDVNIALLADTEEYKDTAILEQLFLGDDITIDFEPFNIKMVKRMVSYTYDSILQRYETIQLGKGEDNYFSDVNDKIDKLPSKEEVNNGLQEAINQAFKNVNDLISNGGNNSYIKFIPNILNPREIVACDNEDLSKAVYCVRFNKAGIGVSTTGFNGTYQGLVTEGKLAINEITCNEFTAALMKTGILSSVDGKTWINLDKGTFDLAGLTWDNEALEINKECRAKYRFRTENDFIMTSDGRYSWVMHRPENTKGSGFVLARSFNYGVEDWYWDGAFVFKPDTGGFNQPAIQFGQAGGPWLKGIMIDAQIQARNFDDSGYIKVVGSAFVNGSSKDLKTNIEATEPVKSISILENNSIKQYNYITEKARLETINKEALSKNIELELETITADTKLGLVLEELTEDAKAILNPTGTDGIDIYAMCSILWNVCREQETRLKKLEGVE